MDIDKSDKAWCADITYIRLKQDFVYLVAILEWYSRKVFFGELSNIMDDWFCVSALESAIQLFQQALFIS